ncbi:uncharacterized protein PF3D7_1120000-like [Diabrotica virgifera virgifera]|uniref:Uncharacterized protein n=1 Tax=Diabrotica virgifera virgifera TaxID=50390 RepID=A0ABM5KY43_DIAVI|nr:uncharacterized protein PF3D7_1120000-like [Diabrotica virgifera virgifera]
MEEIKEYLTEIMAGFKENIKEMRELFSEYREMIGILKEENKTMKEEIQELNKRVMSLEKANETMEQLEKNSKRNNIVISGLKIEENKEKQKEVIKTFIKDTLKIESNITKVTKINESMCIAEIANYEKKTEIMRNKYKLKEISGSPVYIKHDLTKQERKVQKLLTEKANEERRLNKNVKIGYQKITINGKTFKWNNETNDIVEMKKKVFSKN